MPQLQAAKKALRVSQRRRAINDRWRRKMRATLRTVRTAINQGKKQAAQQAFDNAASVLDRTARRNIIHPNRAARKKSRLQKAIANM
jgi:small subunit ribosomal protein S20